MTAWMSVFPGRSSMDFYSPRPVWLQALLTTQPTSQQQRPAQSSQCGATLWSGGVVEVFTWVRSIPLDHLSHVFLTGIGLYSEYGFVFPVHSASTHITIRGLTEDLIYGRGLSHSIASD